MKSIKEMLRKVRNNVYIAKKTKCYNCSKNMLFFKNSANCTGEALKFRREEKLFALNIVEKFS
ncbi:hypothetical protein [Wolbachia endosymbiont of Litomosoides sigmodontis]|uniref:hypothetical protein n=1 Tax=Wolbachia endosymbiont of Litomosoides sigmodontis TaxID=80850 RepID=UPI001C552329|nr:hypothetical protein [Wolbachia endosymbiont of Litomosoides sigmodontis]